MKEFCVCVCVGDAMSAKAISEQTGKEFLYKHICTTAAVQNRFLYATVTAETNWERLVQDHPWLLTLVGVCVCVGVSMCVGSLLTVLHICAHTPVPLCSDWS